MGKDKVNIPPVAVAMAYMGFNRQKYDPPAKMKNSVSSYYTVFCILSGTRRDLKL
ncbi:hypothetical protein ABH916_004991 [Peribacillus frigoritolerans]|uniref:hypothetical protein n=1 Tax=Peribacillus frigoritolerans TaxID=450367 RepID=UPI0014830909